MIDLAILQQVVDKSGSWLSFNNEKIGQGRDSAIAYLKENPKILDEIESQVREKMASPTAITSVE